MGIDFVILWVDGNDPEWQSEKSKYDSNFNDDSNSASRYRDWGLLPFWFRGVEKFTPWVDKIHFVTWGHIPEFLNLNNPKLNVVKHTDFIPAKYLPTFSSHAIELNIHRIPGLSENFVYFNDDMFIIRNMNEQAFFLQGLPCTYGGEVPMAFQGDTGIWQHAAVNGMGVINTHFSKKEQVKSFNKKYISKSYRWQDNIRTLVAEKFFPDYFLGFKNLHAPGAYLKKTFDEVWEKESDLLNKTSSHKFRSADDVNQWVMLWWQIASGSFSPYNTDNLVCSVNENTADFVCNAIKDQSNDMICVNDGADDKDFQHLSEKLKSAFQTILPEKSSFEK